jgi:nicotinamidase/pyrazinamidase
MPVGPQTVTLQHGDALIVIDVQNDFLPGGALAVPEGGQVIPPLNRCMAHFAALGLPVYVTRDWHPANHCSFRERGGPWPTHCVQGMPGAEFSPALEVPGTSRLISKAMDPARENYSDFEGTELDGQLRGLGVSRLFVGGIATDYCVLNTVRDGLRLGYQVCLLVDAIRAVNVHPDDGAKAIAEMVALGARLVTSSDIQ